MQWDEEVSVCGGQPTLFQPRRTGAGSFTAHSAAPQDTDWSQCPACLSRDHSQMNIFTFPGEEGFTIHGCNSCKTYTKSVDGDLLSGMTSDLADLMSLPLDIVVQKQGYARRSPNPIGMVRMSMSG
jgi:formate dehydrogenase maturation protein FdhE